MAPGNMRLLVQLLGGISLLPGIWTLPTDQVPLLPVDQTPSDYPTPEPLKKRPLHGRFLHVTDFHPDRFYETYSSTAEDAACHRGTGPAGIYGAETSECDSPIALVNKTFEWIESAFKDNIDFVVWTGDSVRHDNDENIPRSAEQVTSLNEFMVHKMFEVFGKNNGDERDDDPNNDFIIPVVPNLGNNDVLPHNIMTRGPNRWTRTYANIWKRFIPEVQRHSFEQGGWFSVDVIPGRLAVFSLNTLYFFTSNAAVDGCAAKSEPGYRQMEWLRIQLQYMRDRGMKAILIGHVPPARTDSKTQWDETCWQKYALWLERYRDVVVAGLWGHMNYDHFFLQDFNDIGEDVKDGRMRRGMSMLRNGEEKGGEDGDVEAKLSSNYFVDLRELWAKLPKPPKSMRKKDQEATDEVLRSSDEERPVWEVEDLVSSKKGKSKKDKERRKQKKYLQKMGGEWAERFAVSFASASVVPNLLPVVRVFEYNISGLNNTDWPVPAKEPLDWETLLADDDSNSLEPDQDTEADDAAEPDHISPSKHKKKKKKKKNRPIKFPLPSPPSPSTPPGPAYSPQPLTLLGYTQYLANLTHINNDFTSSKWKEGKHGNKKPHDKDQKPHPKNFEFEVHYDTRRDGVYGLRDLTVGSLVGLARRIGGFVPESLGVGGVHGGMDEEDEDEFETGEVEEDGDDDEDDDDDDGEGDDDDAFEAEKKKKHKGKKGKHHKHRHGKMNEAWYTFIRRAFVETLGRDEIEEEFGS